MILVHVNVQPEMKLRRLIALLCLATLAACSPEAAPVIAAPETPEQQPSTAGINLEGRWRILSIDSRPLASTVGGERAPMLSFQKYSLGGSVGCNSFGGLGLLADGRVSIHSWAGTAIGCHAEVGEQEKAISELFYARPRVTTVSSDRLRLESHAHRVELERIGPNTEPLVPAGPDELTGTSWRIAMMDGQELSSEPIKRVLRFGSSVWQGTASCATLSGNWRRADDRMIVGRQIATTRQLCSPHLARTDAAFANLMRSNPRYLVGPNGELLIAGGGHALAGGRIDQ